MTRTVNLPAIGKSVTLAAYVAAIRSAKANPDTTFKHGLTAWWPCTGQEIMRQFRTGMHDRINQRVPYRLRGVEP
jgi:hypothetical protein